MTKKARKKKVVKKPSYSLPRSKKFLIYDQSCDFCRNVALFFASNWDVCIVPNAEAIEMPELSIMEREKIRKDVHYVVMMSKGPIIYTGSDAVARLLSEKIPLVSKFYGNHSFRIVFKGFYGLTKKLRHVL